MLRNYILLNACCRGKIRLTNKPDDCVKVTAYVAAAALLSRYFPASNLKDNFNQPVLGCSI